MKVPWDIGQESWNCSMLRPVDFKLLNFHAQDKFFVLVHVMQLVLKLRIFISICPWLWSPACWLIKISITLSLNCSPKVFIQTKKIEIPRIKNHLRYLIKKMTMGHHVFLFFLIIILFYTFFRCCRNCKVSYFIHYISACIMW